MSVEAVNLLAQWRGVSFSLDLEATLTGLKTNPFGEHRWVMFMLLTTLIPTLFHLLMVLFAVVTQIPNWMRNWAIQNLEEYHTSPLEEPPSQLLTPAVTYFSVSWIFALVSLLGAGFGLWWTIEQRP